MSSIKQKGTPGWAGGSFLLCERRAIRFVDIGKNEEKVRRYTVRQIGIWRTAIASLF